MPRRCKRDEIRLSLVLLFALASTPLVHGQTVSSSPPSDPVEPVLMGPGEPDLIPVDASLSDESESDWWVEASEQPILTHPRWVQFDLATLILDSLDYSPKLQTVRHAASVKLEEIVQQDAAFDSRYVLEGGYGLTNDPVGNTLVTGGPPRLREQSFSFNGGIRRQGRRGTALDLSQDLGLLDSNSQFFAPRDQGNARINLSLTQPLMAGRGRVFNERLLVQARIDSAASWQKMCKEVSDQIAEIMSVYHQLIQQRIHLLQQSDLIERGERVESIILGRDGFDTGRLHAVKVRQRQAARRDRQIQDTAAIRRLQVRLKLLVGSESISDVATGGELIPAVGIAPSSWQIELADAIRIGLEHRPEVKSAMSDLQSAALGIRVTKNQLMPRLDAVLNGYLAGLAGNHQVFQSFGDQFWQSGPGVSALLQYELPNGNRAAKSRHREALFRYRQSSARLQDVINSVQSEIETALVRVGAAERLRKSKRRTLDAAREEEEILTERYRMLSGDGQSSGVILETVLEAQQRRTEAERALTSAETEFKLATIECQRAMGTLLFVEGIRPIRESSTNEIRYEVDDIATDWSDGMAGMIEADQWEPTP